MTTFEIYMLAGTLAVSSLLLLVSALLHRMTERQLEECRRVLDMCREVRESYAPPMKVDGEEVVHGSRKLYLVGANIPRRGTERECHKCHGAVPDPALPGSYPVWCESCQIWVK